MNKEEIEQGVDEAIKDLLKMGFIKEVEPETYQITELGTLYLKEVVYNG